MSTDIDPLSELTLADQSRVNAICDRFEEALKQGSEPRLEDFLAATSGQVRDVLFRELLVLECEQAFRYGREVEELRLQERFPDRQESIREAMAVAKRNVLIEAEVAARSPGPAVWPSGLPDTFGRFRVLDVVGHGAFGTVFRATDTENGVEVALKVPHLVTLVTPELRERFFREGRAAAALQHSAIVRLLAVGEEGLICYIAFEYVSGTTLAAWLNRCYEKQERVPFETTARLVVGLAAAMQHAHDRGVFHCDLKPANVLLRDGRITDPVVSDFGLARLVGEGTKLTATGQILGTPAYMAPEQAFGPRRPLGPSADVYGLGAILYEMLTGRPPFQAPTPLEIVLQKRNGEPISPRVLAPLVPRALETVCLKCLEEQPERRYSSADALAADLDRWLRGKPVQARAVGPLGRGWRFCRRRPLVASMAVALALALMGGFIGITLQWRQTEAALRATDAARREAEDSETQVHVLLDHLLQPAPETHLEMAGSPSVPDQEVLLKAEAHLLAMLQIRPDDTKLRISLTHVEVSLSRLYASQGRTEEAEARIQRVGKLWETLVKQDPHNPQYREWLSTAYIRQSEAALEQQHFERWVRLQLQAYSLLQALADEQLLNHDIRMRALSIGSGLLSLRGVGAGRDVVLRVLGEEKSVSEKLIAAGPDGLVHRKRLALICLVLGEICLGENRRSDAVPLWRQAHEHYNVLLREQPDDLLLGLNLARCCSRLMTEQASDSYYAEAVALFEESTDRLAALRQQNSARDLSSVLQMYSCCSLVVCHWRAGRTALAEQTFDQKVRPLVDRLRADGIDDWQRVGCLQELVHASELLSEAKPVALAATRQAAALAETLAESPSRDMAYCERLSKVSVVISAMLCRMGDSAIALRLAEQARNLCLALCRAAPGGLRFSDELCDAWERIGKARWELGRREAALAAFREAVAVERGVVEQAPSVQHYRNRLSRCFNRLAYYCGEAGDRSGAAAALLERMKLWPEDAKELQDVARGFQELSEAVGKGRDQLSGEEKAERQRYFTESQRAAEAARKAQTVRSRN